MPIRINLLAETQAAEDARRRDPVKRTIWIGAALIAALLAWSGQLFLKLSAAQREAQSHESAWKQNEGEFKLITDAQKQMLDTEKKLNSLVRLSTNRFLWASTLNGLQQAMVPVAREIQLEQLRALQNYEVLPAVPASKDKKVAAKPAGSVERITILLRARDSGNPNEANYNKFRNAISSQAYLKTLLPKNEGVRLASTLAGPQIDPNDPSRTFYQFALECRFQEVRRDE